MANDPSTIAEPNAINDATADLGDFWENILKNHDMAFECCLPCVVVSYDRVQNLVTAQPAINRIQTNGIPVPRALIVVPCANPCGGGVGINFPLVPGDTGWIVASDRDTTLFQQSLAVTIPNESGLHLYRYGFFVPDKIKGFVIDPTDEGALVIQTLDGTTKISIKDGVIRLTSPQNIIVKCKVAQVTAGESVEIESPSVAVTAESASVEASSVAVTAESATLETSTTFIASEQLQLTGNLKIVGSISVTGDSYLAGTEWFGGVANACSGLLGPVDAEARPVFPVPPF